MLGAPFPGGTAARGVSPGTAAASDLSPDLSARISPVAAHPAARTALPDVNAGLLSAWTAPGADPILTAPDGSLLPAGPGFIARILQVGGISGFVINTTNNPIPNVTVELRDAAQNLLPPVAGYIDPSHLNYCSRLTRSLGAGTYYVGVAGLFQGLQYQLQARAGP